MEFLIVGGVLVGIFVLLLFAISRPRNRRISSGPGAGAAGAVYDMLNEDKRRAIEIIVEGRAEMTDPETADDIPPEEGGPPAPRRR